MIGRRSADRRRGGRVNGQPGAPAGGAARARSVAMLRVAPVRPELRCELLPGLGDGPADHAQALELAFALLMDGTGVAVLTPALHPAGPDLDELVEATDDLRAAVAAEGLPLELRLSAEVSLAAVWGLPAAALECVACGPPHRRWVLLQAPALGLDPEVLAAVDELRAYGLGVVVPQPATGATRLSAALRALLDHGARPLLDARSLLARPDDGFRGLALELALAGLAAGVSSNPSARRAPCLTAVRAGLVARGLPPQVAAALTDRIPRSLLLRGITDRPVSRAVA